MTEYMTELRKDRGMTGGKFALRQLVEKRLQSRGNETVPREHVMTTMGWMGVSELEARLVEAVCERKQQEDL